MFRRTTLAALCALVAASLAPRASPAQPAPAPPPPAGAAAPPQPLPSPPRIDVDDPMLVPVPPAPKTLSGWREALTLIASRSTDLAVATQEVARAEGLTRQALGLALPQIDSKGTLQYDIVRGQQQSIDLTTTPPSVATITVPPTPTALATLTIIQPLFAPKTWSAIGTARRNVEVNKLLLSDRRRTLVITVANAIVAVVTAERVSEVNRVGLQASLERLELTQRRLRAGAGTMLDVVRAQQDTTVARSTLIQGDESLRQSREALGLALGFGEAYGVTQSISLDELEQSARTTCKPGTIEQRPDVLAAKAQVEVSDRQVTEAKLAFSPTVNAVSLMTYSSELLQTTKNYAWSIQGVLTIPIWDGGGRYGGLRVAKANAEESRARVTGAVRGATLEAVQALRSVDVADRARAESVRGRDLARETARLSRVAFESGTGTSFDLVETGRRQREAELDLALKEFEIVKAKIAALLATASCDY